MEHWWIGLQMARVKQRDLLQQAEHFRQLRSAGGARDYTAKRRRSSGDRLQTRFATLRIKLGQLLIDWGTALKRRGFPGRAHPIQTV
jgi:hypothetical protein